jgi:hypothetical protein
MVAEQAEIAEDAAKMGQDVPSTGPAPREEDPGPVPWGTDCMFRAEAKLNGHASCERAQAESAPRSSSWPQRGPKCPIVASRWPQHGLEIAQDGPRRPRNGLSIWPNVAQDGRG